MDKTFTYIQYFITLAALIISFCVDRKKTLLALKKASRMFINIFPQFLLIVLLIGLILAILSPEVIQEIIGSQSGIWGVFISSIVGSITLIPVIVVFPIASELLSNGAGVVQVAVFISTLTAVGLITLPLETKILGKKIAILRNVLFYLFSIVVAYIVGWVLI